MPLSHAERLAYPTFAIEQSISAGQQFTGGAPADNPAFDPDTLTLRHAAGSVGGLFSPGAYPDTSPGDARADASLVCDVIGLEIVFGSQSSWTLHIVSGGGAADVLWKGGTTEAYVVSVGADEVKTLLPGQSLKLTTTGASGAMTARALFRART